MAALLRSARLLKFSPSGLLQVAGTKRSGPPLSRLYSGAPVGTGTGLLTRHTGPAAHNASSRVLPYAVQCVRNCAVAREQKDDVSMLVRSKQAQEFDDALTKLDNSVRRTGRITKTLLLKVFNDTCRADHPSASQALLLLRSCGSLLPELPLAERTELAHSIWGKLQELGAPYDISHYNALLKVYLQNEFKFSPADFLAKMEAANVKPNRVTYQRLIAAYCQYGDIEGASTILGVMKSKDLPITEAVFSSLIIGHARGGDINSAKNILNVMDETGISPSPDTYISLLNAYAETGDMKSLKETLEKTDSSGCTLMDRDILQIIYTLAKAGHHEFVPEMIKRLKLERGYIPDAMNMCLNLTTQGMDNTAFTILETFGTVQLNSYDTTQPSCGNFFIRHCVNINMPLEKVTYYCKELQESNMHDAPLNFALSCVLENKNTGMAIELMKIMKKQDLPIRPHYFWPLLTQHLKDANTAGVDEVLKGMRELGVDPDVKTLNSYVLPVFSNIEDAQQALETAGVFVNEEILLASKIEKLAHENLAAVYTLMSDTSSISLDWTLFRSSLIKAFKKFQDIESMVKITALLCNDNRFQKKSPKTTEEGSFFLYSLIDSMSEREVHTKEEQLKTYFNQLQSENITISRNIYRGIKNLLESYHIPELIKDVAPLQSREAGFRTTDNNGRMQSLENKMSELKAANQPLDDVLKQMIQACIEDEKPQGALNLMQEHKNEITTSIYITLIRMCCRHNYVNEALKLKKEMSLKDPTVTLDVQRYLELVRLLSRNGRVEEALDMLKEIKEKDLIKHEMHSTLLFHLLNSIALKGDMSTVQQLQDTIFTLGLAKPSINLCSPLITAYLQRKDMAGALEAMETIHKRFGFLPRMQDVTVTLVEMGNTELLQKAMDFLSEKRGEMTMLYSLFFAFLQTEHYYEARKVIETPGLRARPDRLQWYAEKCISSKQMKPLEEMVDMTVELFDCDRDEMYSYMLRLCKETNDWKKAQEVWSKMEEENITPKERTLHMLADILKSNGQEVPFKVNETWYKEAGDKEVNPATEQASIASAEFQASLVNLCKKGQGKEAFELLKDAKVSVNAVSYDHVIRSLLAKGFLEEALTTIDIAMSNVPGFIVKEMGNNLLIVTYSKQGKAKEAFEKLKSMLEMKQSPSQLAITRLLQAYGNQGDVAGIQELQTLLNDSSLAKMFFVNNTALAHIRNGNVESAVELLEEVFTNPDNQNAGISFVFKKVLEENNDKALDKLSAMADRLANQFDCYKPAVDLFYQLLNMDKVEDAKFMLARLSGLAEQKEALLSYLNRQTQTPGQLDKTKTALSLFPDVEKEVQYRYLIKCHALDKDFSSAKALYEQIQEEGVAIDELSLKRLALLYRNAGETVPFTEPPESFRFYTEKLKAQASKE